MSESPQTPATDWNASPAKVWYASTGRRVFAILTSGLLPGAGQLILGRRAWAVFWALAPLVAIALEPAFGLYAALASLLTRLGASVHAAFQATGGAEPDSSGKTTLLMALLLVLSLSIKQGLSRDVVENSTMLEATMAPALETGDWVLVDKTAYGLRLPFLGKISPKPPKVGDIVAVEDPDKEGELLVARLVAFGPTTFEMKEGAIVLGESAKITRRPLSAPCKFGEVDKAKHVWTELACTLYEESAQGVTWQSLSPEGEKAPSTLEVRQLSLGQVLVALDNRRGPAPWKIVPLESVRGRATLVWFSTNPGQGIRWARVNTPL